MSKPIAYLLSFLIFLACLAFVYGVYIACKISLAKVPDIKLMPPVLEGLVTSIRVIFANNLGAVLGISISVPDPVFRQSKTWDPLLFITNPAPTSFQTLACNIDVARLFAAAVVWAINGFDGEGAKDVVPLLKDMSKSLLGVIIGALAIALNQEPKK